MKQIFPSRRTSKQNIEEPKEEQYFPPTPEQSKPYQKLSIHSENLVSSRKRRMWTEEEEARLIKGVNTYGRGNWVLIRKKMHLTERTNVELKDKWRNISKKLMQ